MGNAIIISGGDRAIVVSSIRVIPLLDFIFRFDKVAPKSLAVICLCGRLLNFVAPALRKLHKRVAHFKFYN